MRLLCCFCALAAVSGCSLLNAPDRDRIVEDAGGMDAPPIDAADGGQDAGVDTGDAFVPPMEVCDNMADDDLDGLIDCADFDCAESASCCNADVGVSVLDQSSFGDLSDWNRSAPTRMEPTVMGGALVDFADPNGVVFEDCVPFAGGGRVSVRFDVTGETCTDGDCEYAAVTLSPVRTQGGRPRLADELSVTVSAGGDFSVTQAGDESSSGSLGIGEHSVVISLVPGFDGDRPALLPTVRIGADGVFQAAPIDLRNLTQTGACANIGGLFVAVEGRGNAIHVQGDVDILSGQCTNPNQFGTTDNPLTSGEELVLTSSLSFSPPSSGDEWADEAIGSPGLLFVDGNWQVVAEATNDQPEIETTAAVGWSIGHARQTPGSWNDQWLNSSETPQLGAQPPSCWDGTCPGAPPADKVRDPSLFEGADTLYVLYAKSALNDDAYSIHIQELDEEPSVGPIGPERLVLDVARETDCRSLRDPFLVSNPGDAANAWLFFTCVARTGDTHLRMQNLTLLVTIRPVEGEPSLPVFAPGTDFGRFGGEIFNPEVVVDRTDGTAPVFRLWFAGFIDGEVAIGLALGQPKDGADQAPTFQPYPANPVLEASMPAFSNGCVGCSIESFTVARRTGTADLRFLVARKVPIGESGRRFELFPLDQVWNPLSL